MRYLKREEIYPGLKYLLELSKYKLNELLYLDRMDLINYDSFDNDLPMIKRNIRWLSNKGSTANYKFNDLFKEYIDTNQEKIHQDIPICE